MATEDQALAAARRLGRYDAARGKDITDCPYKVDGDPIQRACARAWVRTYRHWRPDTGVDLSDDLAALVDGPESDGDGDGEGQGVL